MRILVFDNYDSFTYNLVHLVEKITDAQVEVYRNDKITLDEIDRFDKIILSPGPGLPKDAGLLPDLIKHYAGKKPILGVCLGHQAIGEAFGGKLVNLEQVYHGVATPVNIVRREASGVRENNVRREATGVRKDVNDDNANQSTDDNSNRNSHASRLTPHDSGDSRLTAHASRLFEGLPEQIEVGRYHSWVVSDENFPSDLIVTARDENGYIMALQHKTFDLQGVQFHPESVLTPDGETIIGNWLKS